MAITVKNATQQDAPFLAKMILQSSRAGKKDGLFDLLFDTDDDNVILAKLEQLVQTEAKSFCHYKNFLIAQNDDASVGTLCSYEPRISNQKSFLEALQEVGCCEVQNEILDIYFGCSFELKNSTLMFDFMEEIEGFLEVGILKALMQKSLLNARLKGYTKAQTVVEIGSLEVELLYKKLGFSKIDQKECEDYREMFGRNGISLFELEF
jgi:hypothetical protein